MSRQDEAPYRSSFRGGRRRRRYRGRGLTPVITVAVAVDGGQVTGTERPGAGRGDRNKVLLTQNSSEVLYFLGYVTRFRSRGRRVGCDGVAGIARRDSVIDAPVDDIVVQGREVAPQARPCVTRYLTVEEAVQGIVRLGSEGHDARSARSNRGDPTRLTALRRPSGAQTTVSTCRGRRRLVPEASRGGVLAGF
jgi:hypothetical protein